MRRLPLIHICRDIIEHAAESASNLKQCSVMCAIIIVLAATKTANADCISRRKGISPPHFCESPLRGWGDAARKNNGDGTQEFRFISIKCKKQVPWLYFMGKLAPGFSLSVLVSPRSEWVRVKKIGARVHHTHSVHLPKSAGHPLDESLLPARSWSASLRPPWNNPIIIRAIWFTDPAAWMRVQDACAFINYSKSFPNSTRKLDIRTGWENTLRELRKIQLSFLWTMSEISS